MKTRHAVIRVALAVVAAAVVSPSNGRAEGLEPRVVPMPSGVFEITIQSQVLEEARVLRVRLPRRYEAGEQRYPVLVSLDAEWHFNIAAADVELLAECSYVNPHPIPELILVGVVNVDRNRDFTPTHMDALGAMRFPTSGGAALFREFLLTEALPTVDRLFRTHPYRILAGWSLGGLFTVDTLLREPGSFDAYLAISPSLWWDDGLTLRLLARPRPESKLERAKTLVITLGSEERDTMVSTSTASFVTQLETAPIPKLGLEQLTVEGLGHNLSPKMAYFLGLATVFSDWVPPGTLADQGLAAIDAHFAALSERYRFPIPVPEGLYGRSGWKLFEEGRQDEARTVFETWVDRHPGSALALASLGAFFRESGETGRALPLLRRALAAEKQSARPRPSFISDLERDIDQLSADG